MLKIGPIPRPTLPNSTQVKRTHTRHRMLNISSILPAMTADGTADKSPIIKRAMNTAATLGTAATTTEKTQ